MRIRFLLADYRAWRRRSWLWMDAWCVTFPSNHRLKS
jgi:hypothetical protein